MSKILKNIIRNADEFPDRLAYVTEQKIMDKFIEDRMTWGELNEISDRLANFMNSTLKSKSPIVVIGHKKSSMISLFIACSKSGRAYVPVDSSFPIGRIKDIIDAIDPELIFCTEAIEDLGTSHVIIDQHGISEILFQYDALYDPSSWIKPDDLCYIIFTSGSTGVPKGVQITAECLDNFISWAVTLGNNIDLDDGVHRRFMNQAPFSFDLSVFDLYLSLYTGGTLYAIAKDFQSDTDKLYDFIGNANASVWVSTPSFAEIALADEKFSAELIPEMRLFLFCGETLTNQTAFKLNNAFPSAEVVNTYGPTESTVAMTSILITEEIRGRYNPLPIGIAKPGTCVFIMDENNNILPEGEKGEIVIVGDTVSTGYWNNEKITAEVFGRISINDTEYRLYHTRDKGCYRDGLLFYLGRIDLQIKLHGYRIELEDIESNVLMVSNVEQAVVLPEYENGEVTSLTAYIVSNNKIESNLKERQRIRTELKNKIPEYMIPKKFVFKESLPVTANGKVDRRSLEAMK